MSEFSVDNNFITFENSQTPVNSSIFNQTIKGSFKSGPWFENISFTGFYADWNAGAQISLRKGTFKLGFAGKFSLVNNSGQLEIFGLQIEGGLSGKVLANDGKFGIGYKDGRFYYYSGVSVLFGWDVYIRIRFDKLFR